MVFVLSFAGKCAYSALPTGTGTEAVSPPPANPRFFVSATLTTGAMGGVAGADAICNSDVNKPTASTYKAMIWSSSRNIYSADWVLRANTTYYRSDGLPIATTDGNKKLPIPLANPIGSSLVVFTGVSNSLDIAYSGYTCSDWSSNAAMSVIGNASYQSSDDFLNVNGVGCSTPYHIYCVEQ